MRNFFLQLCLSLACSFVFAHVADAQSSDERARNHFLAGTSYFEDGRYEAAAEQFMDAFRLSNRPALLLNATTAYERADDFENAALALGKYLELLEEGSTQRPGLESRLSRIEERAEERRRQREELEEARKKLSDRDSRSEVTEIPDAALEEPDATPSSKGGLRWAGVATLGVGGAALIVSLVTGLRAKSAYADLESRCGVDGDACPAELDLDGEVSSARTMAGVSTATLIAGGALAATGLVLVLVGGGSKNADSATGFRLTPGPGEVGLSLRRDF